MKIRYANPVGGKRIPFSPSDEAKVGRIVFPGSSYDGLVERLQPVCSQTDHVFRFKFGGETHIVVPGDYIQDSILFTPDHSSYHLTKMISLMLAKQMFPDNFIDVKDFRFFKKRGTLYTATYSRYVEDSSGISGRLASARKAYATAANELEKQRLTTLADKLEQETTPGLRELITKISSLGIELSHPEANYHVCEGKIVFFETSAMSIYPLFLNAPTDGEERREYLEKLAMLTAILVMERYTVKYDYDLTKKISGLNMNQLAEFFYIFFNELGHNVKSIFSSTKEFLFYALWTKWPAVYSKLSFMPPKIDWFDLSAEDVLDYNFRSK